MCLNSRSLEGELNPFLIALQLPKLLELVGLGYTAWFVYRYLLFKVNLIPTFLSVNAALGK